MHKLLAITILALGFTSSPPAAAFGVDVCFNDTSDGAAPIRNCIEVEQWCRQQPLPSGFNAICKILATSDSLKGLSGTNAIIGGRSLMHSDSVYFIAQLAGFSAWQAYQIMIYSEATDQSSYEPFDSRGRPMLGQAEIDECRSSLSPAYECLAITPKLMGLYKFNDESGGQLLHLHSRYSANKEAPATTAFPTDYFSRENSKHEVLLSNLKQWAFGARDDLCVSGITEDMSNPLSACAENQIITFPMNFFGFAIAGKVPFEARLGTLVINESLNERVLSTEEAFSNYISHDTDMARLGIFLHVLADRVSHHMCTDESYFYRDSAESFDSIFAAEPCGQGNHFLWHAWEQGTAQSGLNDINYKTMEEALAQTWNILQERGIQLGIARAEITEPQLLAIGAQLIEALGMYDPASRLSRMTQLIESHHYLPLPGHGAYKDRPLRDWLDAAKAYSQ